MRHCNVWAFIGAFVKNYLFSSAYCSPSCYYSPFHSLCWSGDSTVRSFMTGNAPQRAELKEKSDHRNDSLAWIFSCNLPKRAHEGFVWTPGWGFLLNRHAMLMNEMNRSRVLPLWSGKAIITEPGAVNEMGNASSIPWAWVEVLQNTWMVCPEMVTTVSLTCSLLSFDVHWKQSLFNDAEAIVADQTLLRFGW